MAAGGPGEALPVPVPAGRAVLLRPGGSYWGGYYRTGLAAMLVAPAMAWSHDWAPLGFALVIAASHTAIGLHLLHLGREATSGTSERPGPIIAEGEVRPRVAADRTVPAAGRSAAG
jgi:hypothetical protein